MSVKRLAGLPGTGPLPEQFSTSGGTHREGVVVEFQLGDTLAWIGNFQKGMNSFDALIDELEPNRPIIVAGGQGYVVDIDIRQKIYEFGCNIEFIYFVPELKMVVFSEGLNFESIDQEGQVWKSRRISWDGMRSLVQKGQKICGEAWSPISEDWCTFELDLLTGDVSGGSYIEFNEKLADS